MGLPVSDRWRGPKCVARGSVELLLRKRLVRDVDNVVEWYSILLGKGLVFLSDKQLERRGGVRVGVEVGVVCRQ